MDWAYDPQTQKEVHIRSVINSRWKNYRCPVCSAMVIKKSYPNENQGYFAHCIHQADVNCENYHPNQNNNGSNRPYFCISTRTFFPFIGFKNFDQSIINEKNLQNLDANYYPDYNFQDLYLWCRNLNDLQNLDKNQINSFQYNLLQFGSIGTPLLFAVNNEFDPNSDKKLHPILQSLIYQARGCVFEAPDSLTMNAADIKIWLVNEDQIISPGMISIDAMVSQNCFSARKIRAILRNNPEFLPEVQKRNLSKIIKEAIEFDLVCKCEYTHKIKMVQAENGHITINEQIFIKKKGINLNTYKYDISTFTLRCKMCRQVMKQGRSAIDALWLEHYLNRSDIVESNQLDVLVPSLDSTNSKVRILFGEHVDKYAYILSEDGENYKVRLQDNANIIFDIPKMFIDIE